MTDGPFPMPPAKTGRQLFEMVQSVTVRGAKVDDAAAAVVAELSEIVLPMTVIKP